MRFFQAFFYVIVAIIAYQLLKPEMRITDVDSPVYDIEPFVAPRLTGNQLKYFSWILNTPIIGNIVLSILRDQNKLDEVQLFASKLDITPTSFTIPRVSDEQYEKHLQAASDLSSSNLENIFTQLKTKSPEEFRYKEIVDYYNSYKNEQISPVSLVQQVIDAVLQSNETLHAVTQMHVDDILLQARESEKRWKQGKQLGLLDGIPFFVKEEIDVKGYETTYGTTFLSKSVGSIRIVKDNIIIERLKNQGAIVMGKVNMHEVGIGVTGFNQHYGSARNPHQLTKDKSYYSGGSSSGSAVVVSAGIVPLSIGCDGGGSIRIPASLCGVVGLFPTFGRIPSNQNFGVAWSVGGSGPFGTTVNDVAISYITMAGPYSESLKSLNQPPVHLNGYNKIESLEDIKIGLFKNYIKDSDNEIHSLVFKIIDKLIKEKKVITKDIVIPHLSAISQSHAMIIMTEMALMLNTFWKNHSNDFGYDTSINLAFARSFTGLDVNSARKIRTWLMKKINDIFKDVDLLVFPTTGTTAPEIQPDALEFGESNIPLLQKIMRFSFLANFCGLPAITVPIGYDSNNLPIGIQFVANHWNEHILLRVARVVELIRDFELKRPSVHFSYF
eukprot:c21954_g3_i1.p1 GENE.c21954_g3_i1~~c21954_g3_i1.p1  ORF type:complete len:622 (-),score=275.65 c21954_g3_i1:37-1869(-)